METAIANALQGMPALVLLLVSALAIVWRRMEKKDDAFIQALTTTLRETAEVVKTNTAAVERLAVLVRDMVDALRNKDK